MRRPVGQSDGSRKVPDLADGLAEFVRAFPAWVHGPGPHRGFPLSWQHYVLGLRHVGLAANREMLRHADACAAGFSTGDGRESWQATIKPYAGL